MQLGMIGLGRMGGNMVRRLMRNGHECSVFDLSPDNVNALVKEGRHRIEFDGGLRQIACESRAPPG